jgi:hypothetical protein
MKGFRTKSIRGLMAPLLRGRRERGQVLPMAALFILILFAAVGLTIDVGRVFATRAELMRAVDAAALAGTLELPDLEAAQDKVYEYMAENEPDASVEAPISPEERQVEVHGTKSVPVVFLRVFGFTSVEVEASATAGFGVLAVDTVLSIDATGSMGAGHSCPHGSGCPIKEAKDAASAFVDVLLTDTVGASETKVGVAPYRGCYNEPRDYPDCIPVSSMILNLSDDKSTVQSTIDDIEAQGGTGTNICLGLLKAHEVIFGEGHHTVSNTMRIDVILSDGDNTYNANSYDDEEGAPPLECRPDYDPSESDDYVGTSCRSAETRERELDVKTMAMADDLKANGIEIFVVGFGVCGTPNDDLCDPDMIGGSTHDNYADRNLLKCIASSTDGTNDHYFEVPSAEDLPGVFTNIARLIGFRLIK